MDLNELTKNPQQIQQLISLLQSLLPEQDKQQTGSVSTQNNTEFKVSPQKQETPNNSHTQPTRVNKFLSMPEMNMHKEDVSIDKSLLKHPPVARTREFEPVEVMCRVCGKKEKISPSLVESATRYKCNRCAASAG